MLTLLDFYKCYRAYVRGKVESFHHIAAAVGKRRQLINGNFALEADGNVVIPAVPAIQLQRIHDDGDHSLKMLAEATGGQAFFPFKLQDLANAFNDIQEELRSQYSIFYKPEDLQANGQFRPILIVAENKKLRVRAKKGYYVPRQ